MQKLEQKADSKNSRFW